MPGPLVNEKVKYVSPFRTGTYDAVIRTVNQDGSVGIDVFLPGIEDGVFVRAASYGPQGRARPQ